MTQPTLTPISKAVAATLLSLSAVCFSGCGFSKQKPEPDNNTAVKKYEERKFDRKLIEEVSKVLEIKYLSQGNFKCFRVESSDAILIFENHSIVTEEKRALLLREAFLNRRREDEIVEVNQIEKNIYHFYTRPRNIPDGQRKTVQNDPVKM